jgi:hypothetical protein
MVDLYISTVVEGMDGINKRLIEKYRQAKGDYYLAGLNERWQKR